VGKRPDPPALILKRISEISNPPRSVDWILDSGQSSQAVDIEPNFGQIILDALHPLIRAEIDAALKRRGSTAAAKKVSLQSMRNNNAPLNEIKFQVICPFARCTKMIHAAFV
jgi:hypothetical protein